VLPGNVVDIRGEYPDGHSEFAEGNIASIGERFQFVLYVSIYLDLNWMFE
jgi:hypothetical protein